MVYFFLVLLFAVFLLPLERKGLGDSRLDVYFYYWLVVLLAMFVGLRGCQDEYSYFYYVAPKVLEYYWYAGKEPLFLFVVSLLKTLNMQPQSIFLFFSSVAVLINAYYLKKYSLLRFIPLVAYMSYDIVGKEYSGLRLGFSAALLWPFLSAIHRRKYFFSLLVVIVAFGVQYVGVLMVLVYFVGSRRYGSYTYIFFILVAYFCYHMQLFDYLIVLAGKFYPVIDAYYKTDVYSYDKTVFFDLKTIFALLVFVFALIRYKEIERLYVCGEIWSLLFNSYFVGVLLLIAFSGHNIFAQRFFAQYSLLSVVLVSAVFVSYFGREAKYYVLVLFLVIAFLNYIYLNRLEDYFLFLKPYAL